MEKYGKYKYDIQQEENLIIKQKISKDVKSIHYHQG